MAFPSKVYDQYTSVLNYKTEITTLNRPFVSDEWLKPRHARRLCAYEILAAFAENYSRDYRATPESGDTSLNDYIREMGDPAWLCDKIRSKLLGESFSLSIPGPRGMKKIERLRQGVNAGNADDQAELAELEALAAKLADREEWLSDWWDRRDVAQDIYENEGKASTLGDCAYLIEWDANDGEPSLKTYDPGFVFPEFGIDEEYGRGVSLQEGVSATVRDRVYIAWEEPVDGIEEENSDSESGSRTIWRDVYELRYVADAKGKRTYSCWRRSGWYEWSVGSEITLEGFADDMLIEGTDSGWVDLGIDFMPVIWVPNIKEQGSDFGRSNITRHLELIDAIITGDTDLDKNAAYLGGAVVSISGTKVQFRRDSSGDLVAIPIAPNSVYNLGENGRMEVLDTANMQKALLETLEYLGKKFIRNTNITEVGAGITGTNEQLSGVALKMLVMPLMEMILPMRQQRQRRYSMLFYGVQRLLQLKGDAEQRRIFGVDPAELYDAVIQFGEIVPQDRKAQLEEYNLMKGVFGEDTTLRRAKEEGWDIDIEAIRAEQEAQRQRRMEEMQAQFTYGRDSDTGGGE